MEEEQIVRNFDDSMILIGKHLVDGRRCQKSWEWWGPSVSQGPAGALQWGLHRSYLLTIYVAQGPYRSPGQAGRHLLQANIPKKGNQVEDKLELQNKNPNNFLHTPCVSWMRSRQRQQQFWGHGHRQWDSRWCQGSVREIGGGEFFVQFHFGWDHAIPHDRVFILLLPRCHTQLGGRSNSMWGENIIATFHSCILFGKYRFWSKILLLVSILL